MKHIGIVAVSTEGAALCYRTICLEGAVSLGPYAHPEISIHNFPLSAYQQLIDRDEWREAGEMLLESANKLVRAGAQLLICPDNTIHQGLDLIRDRSPAPWIHIAEEVTREAQRCGFRRVGILGTRFLMEGPVYPTKLALAGIEYRVPKAGQRERVNRIIYDELVCARFSPTSLKYFQEVIRDLASDGCDAVALACTEIPLLVGDADLQLPTLDSTRILARAALRDATSQVKFVRLDPVRGTKRSIVLTFRKLSREEIAQVWSIDRTEVVDNVYYFENGSLVLRAEHHDVRGWPPGEAERYTPLLLECLDRGGWCFGQIDDARLVGAAILESRFIGPRRDQLQLKFLHVSNAYRRQGVGRRLFELAKATARENGAKQLYVSATPSENTINFYLRSGCRVTKHRDPELLALEPEDIHLECDVE